VQQLADLVVLADRLELGFWVVENGIKKKVSTTIMHGGKECIV
jgi:hypothetical protein